MYIQNNILRAFGMDKMTLEEFEKGIQKEFEQGIQVLQDELRAVLEQGYTGFFHSIDQNTREAIADTDINLQQHYENILNGLRENLSQAKEALASIRKSLSETQD